MQSYHFLFSGSCIHIFFFLLNLFIFLSYLLDLTLEDSFIIIFILLILNVS